MSGEIRQSLKVFFDLLNQYEILFDNINIQTWYLTDPETYSIVNYAHAKFLGKNKNELIDKSVKGILTERCIEQNKKVFTTKKPLITKEVFNNYLGEGRILKVNRVPQLDESGNVAFVMCTGEDITDYVTITHNRDFLGKIVERSYDSIIVTDVDFKIRYINNTTEKLFGYKSEELQGKDPSILNTEENKEEIQKLIKNTIKSGKEFLGTYLNKRKDGSTFYCSYKIMPMYEDGKVVNYIGYHRDITEKVKLETKLKNACSQFESIYNESPISIIIHDKDTGEIVDANKKALESYKFKSIDDMKTNSFWLKAPYSFEDAKKLILKAVEEGPQEIEWMSKDTEGEFFCEMVSLKVIKLDGIDRVLAMSYNITC